MAKFYIYVDDSGKFEKPNNNFVIYSYIVLTKEQRKTFVDFYLSKWWFISNPACNHSDDEISELVQNYHNGNNAKKADYLSGIFKEIPKGHGFICQYNEAIKYKETESIQRIEKFLEIFKIPKYVGSVLWCKNCSESPISKNNRSEHILNRKKYMISIILKDLLNKGIINKSDEVNIFIDEEFTDYTNKVVSLNFQNYLNSPMSVDDLFSIPKILYSLRKNNINCNKLEFMSSSLSPPIRCADIIANLTYKLWNVSSNSWNTHDTPKNVFNYLEKNIRLNWLIFPSFECNILKKDGNHDHIFN